MPLLSDDELLGSYKQPAPLNDDDVGVPRLLSDDEIGATEEKDEWLTGYVLPIQRNAKTGEIRLAVPEAISSGFTAPGDAMSGKLPTREADPVTGETRTSDEAIRRGGETAGLITTGTLAARATGTSAVAKDAAAAEAATPQQALQTKIDALDRAGNINLRRIYSDDDVKQVIQEQALANEEFTGARRGVISNEETADMARLLGMTPEKLSQRKVGEAFNAEEMFAARELLVKQATKVRDLAKTAQGGSDLDKLNFAEEMARLNTIQEQVSGATAEAGRTLQQFRMLAGADKEMISRLVEAQKAGGLDDVIDLASKMDDPVQVANFMANATKAKTTDKLLEAWINGLLSGPATHATNILSNSLVSLWSIPEHAVAAGLSKVTGSGITAREVLGRSLGIIEGAKEGIRAGVRAFRTEEPTDLASKLEARRYRAIGGTTGKVVRLPSRALLAEDEFFKAIGYRQAINELAIREGMKQGGAARIAELRANPTDAMKKAARDAAEKQTFTNPLGPAGNKILGIGRDIPAFRVVAPFIRTPVNIFKFAAQRSPLAPLFKEVRQNLKGANGAIERDKQLARIGVGSAVSGAVAYEALQGHITGGGPADPRERAVLYANGWQPYSVKVGDSYYSYGRLEPMGMLFGVAADFVELQKVMSRDDEQNIAALIMGSVQKNLVSKTWLRGLSDLIEAWNDPDRYGAAYVQGLAGSIVPTGLAQVARVNDPFLRDARTALDAIKNRVPGYKETLPVKRGVFGEPIELQGALGPNIISPIYQSAAGNDPVIAEMIRLQVAPSRPSRDIRGVELTPEEYDTLQMASGRAAKQALTNIVNDPQWASIPDEDKKELIDTAFRKGRDLGRAFVLSQYPTLVSRIAALRAQ